LEFSNFLLKVGFQFFLYGKIKDKFAYGLTENYFDNELCIIFKMSDFDNMIFVTERIGSGWPTLAFLLGEINNENYAEKFQKLKEKIGPLKFKRLVLNLCIDCGMQLCMCAEERIFQLKQLKNTNPNYKIIK